MTALARANAIGFDPHPLTLVCASRKSRSISTLQILANHFPHPTVGVLNLCQTHSTSNVHSRCFVPMWVVLVWAWGGADSELSLGGFQHKRARSTILQHGLLGLHGCQNTEEVEGRQGQRRPTSCHGLCF